MEKVLAEQVLGLSGVTDSQTVARVGKVLGVERVIIGRVSQVGRVIECDAQLVEVETGVVLTAVSSRSQGERGLREMAYHLVCQLAIGCQRSRGRTPPGGPS